MNKKLILAVLTLGLVVAGAVYLSSSPTPAQADVTPGPLTGYAWSSNIGWVKFDHGQANPVMIDGSGNLSGYAWSSNIGWIKFNPASGYPTDGGTVPSAAKINAAGDALEGWAQACSVFVDQSPSGCSGALKPTEQRGGWDGWISLAGTGYGITRTLDGTNYKYEGYAWGGDVVGWLKFNHTGTTCATNVCEDGEDTIILTCDASPNSVQVGDSVIVNATLANAEAGATYDYTINWGDGSPVVGPITRTGSAPVTASHTYTAEATVTVTCNAVNTATNVNYPDTDTVVVGAVCFQDSDCSAWSPAVCTTGQTQTRTCPAQPVGSGCPELSTSRDCVINPPKLEVVPDHGTISVNSSNQSNPAVSSVGVLRNVGGEAGDFKVFSFMSRTGLESVYDIIVNPSEYPLCIYQPFADIDSIPNFRSSDFTTPPAGAVTGVCNAIAPISVAPNQYLALAIKLPVPLESYRSNTRLPYRIRVNPVSGAAVDGATILWTSFTGPTTPR